MNGKRAKELRKATLANCPIDWPTVKYDHTNMHIVQTQDAMGQVYQTTAHTSVLTKCKRKFYKLLKSRFNDGWRLGKQDVEFLQKHLDKQ